MKKRFKQILIIGAGLIFCALLFSVCLFNNQFTPLMTLVVYTLTLGVLIWYAYDTNRIANQTVESNLRPIVLRTGTITKWEDVKFEIIKGEISAQNPIAFHVLKNIALNIEGYFFLDKRKYKLMIGGTIFDNKYFFGPVSWISPGTFIQAVYDSRVSEETLEEDGLLLTYKDIEGNPYFTREHTNFSQTSGRE